MIYLQNSSSTHGGFEIYYDGNNNGVKSEKWFQCNHYHRYVNKSKLLSSKYSYYRVYSLINK